MVVCLVRGADLHMAQRVPLPLTVSCSSKIQIGFTFLVPAHLGRPKQRAVKRVCLCVITVMSESLPVQLVVHSQTGCTMGCKNIYTIQLVVQMAGRNVLNFI